MHYLEYYIEKKDHGKEVLAILRGELDLSTTKIRSVKWDENGILLNERRVTVRDRVCEGQVLKVLKDDSANRQLRVIPRSMPLDILYEDEDLLFVNKPPGVVSHPSKGHLDDSLANGVQAWFDRKGERSSIHLLGRLDKDTSGISGIAKNGVAARRLLNDRREGKVRKEYLAVAEGCFEEDSGVIAIPMEEYRDPSDQLLKMRRSKDPEKGHAKTCFQVVHRFREPIYSTSGGDGNGCSLLRVQIETGRMHQIRFHMAEIGHPLLGDAMYGHGPVLAVRPPYDGRVASACEDSITLNRTALHAHRLAFTHPFSEEKIVLEARLPEDMAPWYKGGRFLQ